MRKCPSAERLELLLEERLDDARECAEIVEHVEHCGRCQRALETLTRSEDPVLGGDAANRSSPSRLPDSTAGSAHSDRLSAKRRGRSTLNSEFGTGLGMGDEHRDWPVVEGYELLARLGQGGMGVVFKARQRGLNRLVALKMIRAGANARPEHVARFRIEAEAAARLDHPNIVLVHHVGESSGLPFVVLELLEGGSLDAKIGGSPRPERWGAEIVATLARAMDEAHRVGILHRDLKSSNVLFTTDGTPKIVDFGLAKLMDVRHRNQTETGQVMGSPSFMSPEQARGRSREIGPAADIYSLGAILYETLTGRPPFRGVSAMETLLQVVHVDPVPPSRLRPKVARDLETICLKCLEKQSFRRYPDARALAEDLDRFLAGRPILARPSTARERLWKWSRRRPATATLGAVAVALLASVLGLGVWRLDVQRREEKRIARVRSEGAVELLQARDLREAGRAADAQLALFSLLTRIGRDPRLIDLRRQGEGELRRVTTELDEDARRRADVDRAERFKRARDEALTHDAQAANSDAEAHVAAARKAARAALTIVATIPKTLPEGRRRKIAQDRHELLLVLAAAVTRPLSGEDPRVQAREGLAILDRAAGSGLETRAYHLRREACFNVLGDLDAARIEREKAERPNSLNAFDHYLIGREHYLRRRFDAAIDSFEKSLQQDQDRVWANVLLAVCYAQTRRPVEARACLNLALSREPGLSWLRSLRGSVLGELALSLEKQAGQAGDSSSAKQEAARFFDAAEADYKAALELEPNQTERYILLVDRGTLRLRRRMLDQAAADLETAVRLEPDRFAAYNTLGFVRLAQGDRAEAARLFGAAIARKPDWGPLRANRARALADPTATPTPQDRAAALRDLDQAVALCQAAGDPVAAALAQVDRARLLILDKRPCDAAEACDAALAVLPELKDAHYLKIQSLLELKKYHDVIESCDGYLARGKPTADLLTIRGLARAGNGDLPGAIEDYTRAIAVRPDHSPFLAHRGWAYLVTDAPRLAARDFEEAVRLDPENADAQLGRGQALARLGRYDQAVATVESALKLAAPNTRDDYNAALAYTHASIAAIADANRGVAKAGDLAISYQERAQELLSRALESLPDDRRGEFWREVVMRDPALVPLRRRPDFARLAGAFARSFQNRPETKPPR